MKIYYQENPLEARIELTPVEVKQLRYKIKINELEELLFSAHFNLEEGQYFNLEKARDDVDYKYYSPDDGENELEKRVDLLMKYYMSELSASHAGDCTCMCAACGKCLLEDMLGIKTKSGLGKHAGSYMFGAFKTMKTASEVIQHWKQAEPIVVTEPWHEGHTDRWNKERSQALAWLEAYQSKIGTVEEVEMA